MPTEGRSWTQWEKSSTNVLLAIQVNFISCNFSAFYDPLSPSWHRKV